MASNDQGNLKGGNNAPRDLGLHLPNAKQKLVHRVGNAVAACHELGRTEVAVNSESFCKGSLIVTTSTLCHLGKIQRTTE